jgi:hypothetical protein
VIRTTRRDECPCFRSPSPCSVHIRRPNKNIGTSTDCSCSQKDTGSIAFRKRFTHAPRGGVRSSNPNSAGTGHTLPCPARAKASDPPGGPPREDGAWGWQCGGDFCRKAGAGRLPGARSLVLLFLGRGRVLCAMFPARVEKNRPA